MKSRLFFHQKAPWSESWNSDCLLIFDRVLLKQPASRRWIRRFPAAYGVKGGERLKDVRLFPLHLMKVSALAGEMASRRLTIVVAGGGSVGDFGGFVASTFKRGVRLVHVPTTWLAALDSAHGGKNGLNVGGAKNQIGTFYPAHEIHVVRDLLASQPPVRAVEAAGEALKMALLKGGAGRRLAWSPAAKAGEITHAMWTALPFVIRGKMSIVKRDPLEKTGVRHLLNLGHTMGHVFEAELGLPHGLAVAYGLVFAAAFSRSEGICSRRAYERVIALPLWRLFLPSPVYARCLSISPEKIRRLLLKDKKRTQGSLIRFVFLKDLGRPVIREVSVDRVLAEVARQRSLLRGLP